MVTLILFDYVGNLTEINLLFCFRHFFHSPVNFGGRITGLYLFEFFFSLRILSISLSAAIPAQEVTADPLICLLPH